MSPLAHVVQNKVETAYARSDLFERRRRLMNDWADYLAAGHGPENPAPRSHRPKSVGGPVGLGPVAEPT